MGFSIGEVARKLGVPAWRIRSIVDRLLPGTPRVGLYRVVPAEDLPTIENELDRLNARPYSARVAK